MIQNRLLRQKITNSFLPKNGQKCTSEKFFKTILKNLNKISKKSDKLIVFSKIKFSLPVFGFINKQIKIKKNKLIKYQPIFIIKNKNRILFSLKHIILIYKKFKIKSNDLFLINSNNFSANKKVLDYKNILTFYRW
jgi:hypothetical protein